MKMDNIPIRTTLSDQSKQASFQPTNSSIAFKRPHENGKHNKKRPQQRLATLNKNKLKAISPFTTFEQIELDRTHKAVEQMLRKKITICSYTEVDSRVKNFVNKLVCTKKSPHRNNNKQKLTHLNQPKTDASQENQTQLDIPQFDYYFNTPNQQAKSLMYLSQRDIQVRKSEKMLTNNKLNLLRSGSAALVNKKQTINSQKRIRFIVRSYERQNESALRNKIQNQESKKQDDNNQQYFQQRQIQKALKKQEQTIKTNNKMYIKQDQECKRRMDLGSNRKINKNEVGNYKSTCDQFRIKKRINVGNDRGVSKQGKNIQLYHGIDVNQHKQQIRGWNDQEYSQMEMQEFRCISGRMSSLRLEQTNMAEAEFVQFIQKSKQDETHTQHYNK